jgi:hypothetical protein
VDKFEDRRKYNKGTWKKGQSGNPMGRPPKPTLVEHIRMALTALDPDTRRQNVAIIVQNVIDMAKKKDKWAMEMVWKHIHVEAQANNSSSGNIYNSVMQRIAEYTDEQLDALIAQKKNEIVLYQSTENVKEPEEAEIIDNEANTS